MPSCSMQLCNSVPVCLVTALLCIFPGKSTLATPDNASQTQSNRSFISFYDSQGACNVTSKYDVTQTLTTLITSKTHLVYIGISFEGNSSYINGPRISVNPYLWISTRGSQGEGLLFLEPHFEILSLSTLSYGIERLDVTLWDSPEGCFTNREAKNIVGDLRRVILTDFNFQNGGMRGSTWLDTDKLCGLELNEVAENAEFHYMCCNLNATGGVECSVLQQGLWIMVLQNCIIVLTCICAFYSPLIIPQGLYNMTYGEQHYEYSLPSKLKISIQKRSRDDASKLKSDDYIVVPESAIKEMPELALTTDPLNVGENKEIFIDKVLIDVMTRRLLPEDNVPIGILHSLYEALVRCKIRRREPLNKCCTGSVWIPSSRCKSQMQWHECLQVFMHFVMILLIPVPYFIRLIIYFNVERQHLDYKRETARVNGLAYGAKFTGSLTTWLGPGHPLLLTCYTVIFLAFALGVIALVANKSLTSNFIFILRNCFRDMSDPNRSNKSYSWSTKVLLSPFTFLGFMGLFIAPFYWIVTAPLVLIILICTIVPVIFLVIRLIANFFLPFFFDFGLEQKLEKLKSIGTHFQKQPSSLKWLYKDDLKTIIKGTYMYNSEKRLQSFNNNICIQGFFTLFCIFSIVAALFLAIDVILLIFQFCVYATIGVILNAVITFKFAILAISLFFYIRDCLNGIRKKYLAFNKIILEAVKESVDGVLDVANLSEKDQRNVAFAMQVPSGSPDVPRLVFKGGNLKWKLNQIILFLDKQDTPFITEAFFFKTCEMPYEKCPGRFLDNFLRAVLEISVVIMFLLFVIIIVLAFGENFEISATNQTLATLAGSFLPLILRKFFFTSNSDFSINTSKIKFKTCLNEVIANFSQVWNVTDIHPCDEPSDDENFSVVTYTHCKTVVIVSERSKNQVADDVNTIKMDNILVEQKNA